jgi:hypothetical protein
MVFLAVSTLEKLKKVPGDVWLKLGAGVLILVVTIIILRKLAKVNKFVLFFIIVLTGTILGFNWIYERNEPKFLTPLVEKVAPFFPSKGAYTDKQQKDPKGAR